MKRTRRWIARVVIALLVGSVVTVAISWTAMRLPGGNAWYGPRTTEDLGLVRHENGQRYIRLSRGSNAWHTVVSYWWVQVSGMSMWMPLEDYEAQKFELESLPRRFRPDGFDDFIMMSWYHEVGWPLPAMTCSVHWDRQVSNSNIIYSVRGGVQFPRDAAFNPRAVPLVPIWWGFLGNALLYGGLWMLAAWGLRSIRRRFRRKKGVCPGCGYLLRGLRPNSRCPECGAHQLPFRADSAGIAKRTAGKPQSTGPGTVI